RPKTGSWALVQDYGSNSTYTWNTGGFASGTYYIEVHVQATSGIAMEAWADVSYNLEIGAPCTSAALQASPGSPQPAGSSVAITATAGGCTSPQYQFWVRPKAGSWALVQDYNSNSSFTWNTIGLASGAYYIEVHV